MVPYRTQFLSEGVEAFHKGYISEQRLNTAVRRILELKWRLGLLHGTCQVQASCKDAKDYPGACTPIEDLKDVPDAVKVQERLESLQAAQDGLILLKNTQCCLPLRGVALGDVVAVVGPNAESASNLLGAWTYHWQGPVPDTQVSFESVGDAFRGELRRFGAACVSATGVTVAGEQVADSCLTVAAAASKAIIFVYGEGAYAEVFGDTPSAYLPAAQLELATKLSSLARSLSVPMVGVYIGGRDRLLASFDALFDAHIAGFYPGPFGGQAVARTILGAHNPCGRLPITLHTSDSQQLPYWRARADYTTIPPCLSEMDPRKQDLPLYPYGYGLSYTQFEFSTLTVDVAGPATSVSLSNPQQVVEFGPGDSLSVSVTVSNTGKIRGGWPILIRLADDACIVPPPPPMVKCFSRVDLEPGTSTTVKFKLPLDAFGFEASSDVVEGGGRFIQPGTFTVSVEELSLKLVFRGDALKVEDWHVLRQGEIAYSEPLDDLY